MKFWERIQIAYDTFRRLGGIELPTGNGDFGRSSDENISSSIGATLNKYQTINPIIDFEMLALLKKFYIFNPDISQFVTNIQNLANNGHSISVVANNPSVAENALSRLNESATRIYKNGAGVDGLINDYLAQIAWSGALSSEDVVNFRGKRIEQVVFVPVESIRFKYDDQTLTYVPYQRTNNLQRQNLENLNLIKLNSETYRYYALSKIENSPYGKPPGTAAIEPILNGQEPMMKNIQYMIQKFGLLGFVTASVTPPPKKNGTETEAEYQIRAKNYLERIARALEGQFSKGFLVSYRDQKLEHTNIAEGASGVYDINRITEEQTMSGVAMQPAFFGRTDSTTETYADVVYNLLLAQVHNVQRLPKRRMEQTYRLDLRLAGIEVDGISLKFNQSFSRNQKANAETDEILLRNVITKVEKGLISPDQAAQELGYESWFDAELIQHDVSLVQALAKASGKKAIDSFQFSFNKKTQKYEFIPQSIQVLSGENVEKETLPGNVLPILKKKTQQLRVSN